MIAVTVCYITSSIQEVVSISVPNECTLIQAVEQSGLTNKYKLVDFTQYSMGIYGKVVERTYRLKENDRIEIYRPLHMDPMQARRQRATIKD